MKPGSWEWLARTAAAEAERLRAEVERLTAERDAAEELHRSYVEMLRDAREQVVQLTAALRSADRALAAVKADRPTVHRDGVWALILKALDDIRAVLADHAVISQEPTE